MTPRNKIPVRYARQRAFSLIEILIVVGIIIVLMGILVPALSHAKKLAQATDTQAEMAGLQTAIDTYYETFRAYPGPISEANVTGASPNITANQNLLIALTTKWVQGSNTGSFTAPAVGVVVGPSSAPITTDSTLTSPPLDYSTGGRPYTAFWQPKAKDYYMNTGVTGLPAFPVINDHFADGLPILYYRRTPGVDAKVQTNPAAGSGAFYINSNTAFTASTTLIANTGNPFNQNPPDPTSGNPVKCTYENPDPGPTNPSPPAAFSLRDVLYTKSTDSNGAAAYTPRGGYALISAGKDSRYGAVGSQNDDIIVVGGH